MTVVELGRIAERRGTFAMRPLGARRPRPPRSSRFAARSQPSGHIGLVAIVITSTDRDDFHHPDVAQAATETLRDR